MRKIIKIEIQGASGNCPISEVYQDQLTLEPNQIQYQYIPLQPSDQNSAQSWTYRTTSVTFEKRFQRIAKALPKALKINPDHLYTEIGGIEFYITYDDNTTERCFFYVPADEFAALFRLIRLLIPSCEDLPHVIMTSKDYAKLKKEI